MFNIALKQGGGGLLCVPKTKRPPNLHEESEVASLGGGGEGGTMSTRKKPLFFEKGPLPRVSAGEAATGDRGGKK